MVSAPLPAYVLLLLCGGSQHVALLARGRCLITLVIGSSTDSDHAMLREGNLQGGRLRGCSDGGDLRIGLWLAGGRDPLDLAIALDAATKADRPFARQQLNAHRRPWRRRQTIRRLA